jgi:hypothetical protein
MTQKLNLNIGAAQTAFTTSKACAKNSGRAYKQMLRHAVGMNFALIATETAAVSNSPTSHGN